MEESVPCANVKIKFHSFHEPVNSVMYSDNTSVFGKSDFAALIWSALGSQRHV